MFVCKKKETCQNELEVVPSLFSEKSVELFSHMWMYDVFENCL